MHHGRVREIGDTEVRVSEAHLSENAERARGMVLARLQMIWDVVAPHLDGREADEGRRPDPRMVETGIRVLDRVTKLYRLLEPPPAAEPPSIASLVPADVAAIERSLAALEARRTSEA